MGWSFKHCEHSSWKAKRTYVLNVHVGTSTISYFEMLGLVKGMLGQSCGGFSLKGRSVGLKILSTSYIRICNSFNKAEEQRPAVQPIS